VLANKKHSKAPEQPFKEGPEQMHAKSVIWSMQMIDREGDCSFIGIKQTNNIPKASSVT
jgi:hypothetical protein